MNTPFLITRVQKCISWVLLVFCLGIWSACTPTCPYTVDAQLLMENDQEMGRIQMSFRPPVGMEMVDLAFTDSISGLRAYEAPFDMRLIRIYVDTVLQANVTVSDMQHIPAEKTENELDFYQTTFNAQKQWNQVSLQRYKTEQYPKIVELTMQNNQMTLNRVYFYNDTKAQFCIDYYYPTLFEKDFRLFVQSSIASVKPYLFIDINPE